MTNGKHGQPTLTEWTKSGLQTDRIYRPRRNVQR